MKPCIYIVDITYMHGCTFFKRLKMIKFGPGMLNSPWMVLGLPHFHDWCELLKLDYGNFGFFHIQLGKY
jgi:hypothetical protein